MRQGGAAARSKHGPQLYGGGNNFRLMHSGSWLSMHNWGCAVDFAPANNVLGDDTPHFANTHEVLDAFAGEAWVSVGGWRKKDGLHWQARHTGNRVM